jgi:hypothetical protein
MKKEMHHRSIRVRAVSLGGNPPHNSGYDRIPRDEAKAPVVVDGLYSEIFSLRPQLGASWKILGQEAIDNSLLLRCRRPEVRTVFFHVRLTSSGNTFPHLSCRLTE